MEASKPSKPDESRSDVNVEYDEYTGHPTPESLTVDDVAATQELIGAANHLVEMEETTGWAILMGYLGEEINAQLAHLRIAKGDEVVRTQCLLEALELLPAIVKGLKEKAGSAHAVLAEYTMQGTAS
jgi:hypothetical protein